MTLQEALTRFRRDPKDFDAWETIVSSVYDPLVLHVGSLLLGFRGVTSDSAADIVHGVLLTFHQRWPKSKIDLESLDDLLRYLRRSCRNLLIDRYRHEKHAQEFITYLSLRFSNAFAGDAELYRSIFLKEIIGLLPKQCADMLTTYINEELTPAEMAEREGASPAAFYSRWYRCLEKAQQILLQKKGRLNR
jgi:DNA-directed RNA polymerase specialized sigma24 family protein